MVSASPRPAQPPRQRRLHLRRRTLWTIGSAVALLVIAAALVFEPWKLVIDRHIDEPVPGIVAAAPAAGGAQPAAPVVLARGQFISHEHESRGSVEVLRLGDGSRVLRLQDLHTSDGPWLQVWITDAPVIEGSDGWGVFDDGRHVSMGDLKGNVGSSNYAIPVGVDLDQLTSVSIWCNRFNVSFAAATLQRI